MNHGIDAFKLENVEASLEINVLPNNLEEEHGIGIDFLFCLDFYIFLKEIKNKKRMKNIVIFLKNYYLYHTIIIFLLFRKPFQDLKQKFFLSFRDLCL